MCDGGKNYYGRDYTISGGNYSTGSESDAAFNSNGPHEWVPCACGYQGNETSLFYQAANIWSLSWADQVIVKDSCEKTMRYNNNQGFLGISGGPPPSHTIDYSGANSGLEISFSPATNTPVPQNPPWYV